MKRAGDSLPESSVAILNEESMPSFISLAASRGVVALVVLTEKEVQGTPVMLRNLAISLGNPAADGAILTDDINRGVGLGLASVGIIVRPSADLLRSLGDVGVPLPTMAAIFTVATNTDDSKQKSAKDQSQASPTMQVRGN